MKKKSRIRDLREDKDLSQEEIASLLNLGRRTYAYYEEGKRNIPNDVLVELAVFHKTSVDYICGLGSSKTPHYTQADIQKNEAWKNAANAASKIKKK